jgi:type III secretory pathway component EscT
MLRLSKEKELPSGMGIVVGLCLSIPLWIAIIAAGYWIHHLMF